MRLHRPNKGNYNNMLLLPPFWEALGGDKVLMFEGDTVLCAAPTIPISEFASMPVASPVSLFHFVMSTRVHRRTSRSRVLAVLIMRVLISYQDHRILSPCRVELGICLYQDYHMLLLTLYPCRTISGHRGSVPTAGLRSRTIQSVWAIQAYR